MLGTIVLLSLATAVLDDGAAQLPFSTRYVANSWTVAEGLPQTSVADITEDDDGFIWVATFGGLARFDGHSFVRADPARADVDGHRFLSVLAVGDSVFAGTDRGRLFRFARRGRVGDVAPAEVVLPRHGSIWDIVSDGDALVVAAGTAGVFEVRGSTVVDLGIGKGIHAAQVRRTHHGCAQTTTATATWVRHDGGVTCLDGSRVDHAGFFTDLVVVDDRVFAATDHGIVSFDGAEAPVGPAFTHIAHGPGGWWGDDDGNLVVTAGHAVGRERVFLPARRSTGARTDDTRPTIRTLFVDERGDVWVGSDDAGLFLVRDRSVTQLGRQAGLVGDSVLLALPEHDGGAFLSSYCRGLQHLSPDGHITTVDGLAHDACVSALAEEDGHLYADRSGDLVVVDDGSVSVLFDGAAHGFGGIHAIVVEADGFWLGTRAAGLVHLARRAEGLVIDRQLRTADGLPADDVRVVVKDGDRLLVGTAAGAAVVDAAGARRLKGAERVAQVRDIVKVGEVIYVATYGEGLARVEHDVGTWFTSQSGLCDDALSRLIVVDDRLWVNGNRGVFHLPLAALTSPSLSESACVMLETGEGNGGGQGAGGQLQNGDLIFPTVDGVALVNPRTPPHPSPTIVVIDDASVDGVELDVALDADGTEGSTVVPPGRRHLQVTLATPMFGGGSPVFDLQLRHDDVVVTTRSTSPRIDFAALVPAAYELSVRRHDSPATARPAVLRFTLEPAWHEAPATRLAVAVAAVLALLGAVWARTRVSRGRQRALQAEVDRDVVYRVVFERSPGALFLHATGGGLLELNAAAEGIVGPRRPELLADDGSGPVFLRPSSRAAYVAMLQQAVRTGRADTIEVTVDCPVRGARAVQFEAALLTVGGAPRVLVAGRDVTAAHEAEAERDARREHAEAERRLEGLTRLAGGVAHDFNNVLAALQMQAELVKTCVNEPGEVAELADEMQAAVVRGRDLTRRFLVFGRGVGDAQDQVLDQAVRDAVPGLRRMMRPGVTLDVVCGAGGAVVTINATHFEQCLLNLVQNAQEASPDGGVVRIRTGLVDGAIPGTEIVAPPARPYGASLVGVWVEDAGQGMSDDVLAHAFDPFFTTHKSGKSVGIGLTVVHSAAVKAGMGIAVTTKPGGGTSVLLTLSTPSGASLADDDGPLVGATGGRRILVVDDEVAVRLVVVRMLERDGFVCVDAEDGERALDLYAQNPAIDLVVTDLMMPNTNGAELIDVLRRRGYRGPAVVFSGFIGSVELPAGVIRLEKPFSARALRQAVDAAFALPSAAPSSVA